MISAAIRCPLTNSRSRSSRPPPQALARAWSRTVMSAAVATNSHAKRRLRCTRYMPTPNPINRPFLRDSLVSTAIAMLVVNLIFAILAGPTFVGGLAGDQNTWVFTLIQALQFAAGVWIILVGVRMIIAEIVPAFEGISTKLIPNAVPALDVPIVFPYAPTAVIVGFASSVVGGLVSMLFLGPLGLALILPGMVPHFFTGAGAGVFGNAMGGRIGAIVGGFINGVLITFLPAFLLQFLGELGFANTTFGDADFAWVGIVTGYAAEAGPLVVWVWAIVLVAATFVLGYFFPKLRPDYLARQG